MWQPIETAPKGKPILLYQPSREAHGLDDFYPEMMMVAEMEDGYLNYSWEPVGVGGYEWEHKMERPTHWMPLPAPPDKSVEIPESGK